jgi:hypothetical protein
MVMPRSPKKPPAISAPSTNYRASMASVPYGELIMPVFTQWERVGSITGILQSLEQGIFYDAALLASQMFRDDRVAGTTNVRFQSILGSPLHMEPQDPDDDRLKVEKITDQAERRWCYFAPDSELVSLMRWGITIGVGIARKEWLKAKDGSWEPFIKTWHPGALWFDVATDTYMLNTKTGVIPIVPGDPNWLLFTPYGHKYARTEGMLRAMAMLYLCRQWAFRDRARHSERHGMPFLQLIVPAQSDEQNKQDARKAIAALGTETVSVTPQGIEGNRFDWKLIEPRANSHETFSAQIDHLDKCIAILVLGQSMSTETPGGLGAHQKSGDTVRRDIMRFDAQCLKSIGADLLGDWAMFNFGDRDLAPLPCYEIDPPEDGLKKAQELNQLGDALTKLRAFGVDAREVLESIGIPLLSDSEFAAQQAEDAETAANEAAESSDEQQAEDDAGTEKPVEKSLLWVVKKIEHRPNGWHVYSEDGKKHLGGPYKSRAQAERRLRQIEYFKHNGNGKTFDPQVQ